MINQNSTRSQYANHHVGDIDMAENTVWLPNRKRETNVSYPTETNIVLRVN